MPIHKTQAIDIAHLFINPKTFEHSTIALPRHTSILSIHDIQNDTTKRHCPTPVPYEAHDAGAAWSRMSFDRNLSPCAS